MIALPFVAIDVLVVVLWTIAAALAIALIMNKLAGVLDGIPGIGGWVAGGVKAMAHAITNACGTLLSGAESVVGGALHWVARHFEAWLNQFVTHAVVIERLAAEVANGIYGVSGLRALVHSVSYVAHAALALADKLEREFKGIEAGVKTIERELAKGIGNDVRTSVDHLLKWERVAKSEIKKLEREVGKNVPIALSDLEQFIKAIPGTDYLAWAAGIVTAGIAAVGNGWLACKENPFSSSKNPCGLWADFARFLPLLGLLAISFDFPEFVNAAETVAEGIGSAVGGIEGAFAASLPPLPPPQG